MPSTHPALPLVKEAFPGTALFAAEFRGDTTLLVPADSAHAVLAFLKTNADCAYDFLSEIAGVDYLNYPKPASGGPDGRFGVVYLLDTTGHAGGKEFPRLRVKVLLNPTLDTLGIEADPALHLKTVTDLWPGAEWMEREVFDMLGIRFDGHPDLRRILTWEAFPAHPLRKDYPVKGRGERENYVVTGRESA